MPNAVTSLTSLSYMPEATFGVIPGSGTVYALRFTSENLVYNLAKEESKEINATRSVSSVTPVSASSGGSISCEMQYAEYDRFMAATLQSTFTVYGTNGVGSTFTADFTATTITASVAPTGNSAFTLLKKGQFFRLTTAGTNNGKLFRVSKTTAPTSTVITLDTSTPATVGTSVATCSIQAARLTNGSAASSFVLQRAMNDVAQFFAYTGQTVSKMDLGLSATGMADLKFEFKGSGVSRGASTLMPSAATASYNYEIHSGRSVSSTQTCILWENGTPAGTFMSVQLSYDNSVREQRSVCNLAPVGIGSGNIQCTVSAEIYFQDGNMFDRFIADTDTELCFSSMDASGNGYVFTLPTASIVKYEVVAGGKDQDIIAKVDFKAVRDQGNADSTLRQVLFIDRVGAAVT